MKLIAPQQVTTYFRKLKSIFLQVILSAMKKLVLLIFTSLAIHTMAVACDINIAVDKSLKKELYKTGDELVVVVTVQQSHRRCTLAMDKTTYEPTGLKIMAATDWKELTPGFWERKMKLKVTGTADGKLSFGVSRSCTKEDSHASLQLKSVVVR